MLELHCHTTYSDGTYTPRELVYAAYESGVRALAITDHDTMAGWDEAMEAARGLGIEIVPGLELSTTHNNCSLHVLAFYPDREKLSAFLAERRLGRIRRAETMVHKLEDLGLHIEFPNVETPGRPHIARALVRAGYLTREQEAYDRYLGDGKPAYVPYDRLSAVDGIAMLRSCGAVPVWAHPYLFQGGPVAEVLPELVAAGLMGLEVYHSDASPRSSGRLKALAEQYGLICTGGSDFHGTNKDHVYLNMLKLPLSLLDDLKAAHKKAQRELSLSV
ncbi:MAG: PHP domain-containing protein [Gloeobacterales cyanobacterium]